MFALLKSRKMIPVLVLLVFLLFLFPAKVGSFQSTHGPTSALDKSLLGVVLCSLLLVIVTVVSPMLNGICFLATVLCQPRRCPAHEITYPVSLRC